MFEGEGALADQLPVEVDDVIILLLGAPSRFSTLKDRIEGITRLEKLIYLLEVESDLRKLLSESADFQPNKFGPFSSKIYHAIESLEAAGLVEDSTKLADTPADSWESLEVIGEDLDPYATRDISITDLGRSYYRVLVGELPKGTEAELSAFKDQFGRLPLRDLIRYVYTRHPEMTVKSVIRKDVLGW